MFHYSFRVVVVVLKCALTDLFLGFVLRSILQDVHRSGHKQTHVIDDDSQSESPMRTVTVKVRSGIYV